MSELLEAVGLSDTAANEVYAQSAVEWLEKHTTVDTETSSLSPSAKLFILKYSQLLTNASGVASESISGLSQSFVTGQSLESQIYGLASAILGNDCLKSTVTVFSGEDRWSYEC